MDTTTVLSMRSLTTLPMRVFLRLRAVVSVVMSFRGARASARRALLLLHHREQARHFTAALADLQRVVELLHGVAEADIEQLLAQFGDTSLHLVRGHLAVTARLLTGHDHSPPSAWRSTKRVLIGSFEAPSANASRASSREMPSISNITRPGLMT